MASDDTLESWKEIAAYLKRDVTTVQRWEKREGLPIHRHVHDKSGSVFALKPELDRWRRARTRAPDSPSDGADPLADVEPDRELPALDALQAAPTSSGLKRATLFGVGLAALLLTVGGLRPRTTLTPSSPIAFAVTPADGLALLANEPPVIAPDGRSLVYVAMNREGIVQLWVRALDDVAARALPGTEGARHPFWSADARQIAFFANGRLMALTVRAGEPRAICEAPFGQAGAWTADGTILFPLTAQSGLHKVRMEGGTPVALTRPDTAAGDFAHRAPHFLPDGRRFVFLVKSTSPDREGIYVGSLDGSGHRKVLRSLSEAWYAAGHLLFVQPPALMAVAIHPQSLVTLGAPVALTRETSHESFTGRGLFSAAENGTVVYSTVRQPLMRLAAIDRDGRRHETNPAPGVFWDLARSPDGRTVAMTRLGPGDANRDIWLLDVRSARLDRLTADAAEDAMPVWSPDGRQIAFSSRRLGTFDVFVQPAASGSATPLIVAPGDQWVNHWSSDGQFLLYSATTPGNDTRSDLFVFDLVRGTTTPLVRTSGRDTQARFSPDGRWIAYSCDARGQPEILVRPFPSRGQDERVVSVAGGSYPRWRGDGQELYYIDAAGSLVAVSLTLGATARPGAVHVIARGQFARLGPTISGLGADYVPSADGLQFLIKEPTEPVAPALTVRVNAIAPVPASR